MIKRVKVISWKQLPSRLPINSTIAWFLLLDHFRAPDWIWGVVGTFFALTWIAAAIAILIVQKPVELEELVHLSNRGRMP